MRILRVYFSSAANPQGDAWALFDSSGAIVDHANDARAQRPAADRCEAILGADAIRIVSLALPPMPASRVEAAAAYALEDRVAAPDRVAIAAGPRSSDGRVIAIVADRDLAERIARATPPFARAIAESNLATTEDDGWRWCESERSAFVRTDDGGAIAVTRTDDDALPPELALALTQAAREGRAPAHVIVDRSASGDALAEWSRSTGTLFVSGTPWDWRRAPATAFDNAIDVLPTLRRRNVASTAPAPRFTTAAALVVAALAVHVVAMLATWGWTHWQLSSVQRDLVPLAQSAGASNATPSTASADINRLFVAARHRAGLAAPVDAMPVLARAAPALAALPPNALKSATWSAGAWTVELAPLDDATVNAFVQRLASAGLTPLSARTQSGVRARIAP
ncbi:MAG TPA: type II secretion system protein GspL [Casimicrobiaceae bacterium]|nr:type II secretion system protein GspL [Casimicrobiaceae bacterium]